MTSEKGYNGWTNYETWAVNLWLSNDEGAYHMVNEMAEEAHKRDKENRIYNLAGALKDMHEEFAPEIPASVYSDLMSRALQRVEWNEIAELWLEGMEFEEEEEEEEEEAHPWEYGKPMPNAPLY